MSLRSEITLNSTAKRKRTC